jgi:hypothetical protein
MAIVVRRAGWYSRKSIFKTKLARTKLPGG